MLLPDFAKEIEAKLEDNSSSTRTQINLKSKFTQVRTPLAQFVFGSRNSSSTYKQMIRSIYEIAWNTFSTSRTTQSPLDGRHPFSTYTQIQSSHLKTAWISLPMRWQRSNSSPAKVILSQNYLTTFGKSPALMIFRFNTVLPL